MVTGDRADAAETIGAALDIDAVLSDRVPADKVDAVAMEKRLHPTLMVGDGINDAPALAAADVGIALGARGASASSEAADVVIVVDRLDRVSEAVMIARRSVASPSRASFRNGAVGECHGLCGLRLAFRSQAHLHKRPSTSPSSSMPCAPLAPGGRPRSRSLPGKMARDLGQEHRLLEQELDKLRSISEELDDAIGERRSI